MSEAQSHRDSEDVEQGETSPLLGASINNEEQHGTSTNWKDYTSNVWAQTTSYIQSWRHARSDRGKQRQVDHNNGDGPEGLHVPTERQHSSRVEEIKADHPYIYWIIVSLLTLIVVIFFLLLIALAHLYLVTLRTPDDFVQARIVDRSLSMDGPDEVKVLKVGSDGVTISIIGRIGIDSDSGLDEWLGERKNKGWYDRKERDVIEWALGKIKGVQVDVGRVALRSPDWSVLRKVEPIHLLPENETTVYAYRDNNVQYLTQLPTDLVTFHPDPLYVPLPAIGSVLRKLDGPAADTILNLTLLLKPSGPDIFAFAKEALESKRAIIDLNINSVKIRGLSAKELTRESLSSFRHFNIPSFVDISMGDTWRRLGQKIPRLDGGNGSTGPDDFLNLTHYDFFEIGRDSTSSMAQRALGIRAYAEAKNPLGKLLKGHVEYSLPFGVYLPLEDKNATRATEEGGKKSEDLVLLAAVASDPFDINGEDRIKLQLQGRVVPPPQPTSFEKRDQVNFNVEESNEMSKSDAGADALSGFLSRFLSGKPNTVYVRGGSPFTKPSFTSTSKGGDQQDEEPLPGGGSVLPAWLDKLLRTLLLPISFPGAEVTDLIQNVTINDLKISPHPFEKEKLLCSGTVMGVMNMPGELATVDVDITDLWPDILVFNGKPPSMKHGNDEENAMLMTAKKMKKTEKYGGDNNETPEPSPLPNPLPDHAFGRVTPHTWSPAKTYIDPEDPKRQRKLLYSELKDVPFTVLPGRGAEFRTFSWKIVTGEGARAGIEGTARAKIWNSGLGKLQLSNLPVKGVFTVGKRGEGGGDGDGDGDDGFSQ